MMRFFLISLLSNLSLYATMESIQNKQPEFPPLIWLIVALLLIGVLFWSFYKALKDKNLKYGYLMVLILLMLFGLLFM